MAKVPNSVEKLRENSTGRQTDDRRTGDSTQFTFAKNYHVIPEPTDYILPSVSFVQALNSRKECQEVVYEVKICKHIPTTRVTSTEC